MVNFGPLTAEIRSAVWGTPANFNDFRVLALLLQRRRTLEANKTLHDLWPSPVLVHYIHFWGLLPPNGILPAAKFTFRLSLVFSYIGSVTAWHSSSGHQPNFVRGTRNGITELSQRAPPMFGIGPHSSFNLSQRIY